MYVRKKKNRSGTISVVVVDKSSGRYHEIKSFGIADSEDVAKMLCIQYSLYFQGCGKHISYSLR